MPAKLGNTADLGKLADIREIACPIYVISVFCLGIARFSKKTTAHKIQSHHPKKPPVPKMPATRLKRKNPPGYKQERPTGCFPPRFRGKASRDFEKSRASSESACLQGFHSKGHRLSREKTLGFSKPSLPNGFLGFLGFWGFCQMVFFAEGVFLPIWVFAQTVFLRVL